MCDILNHIRLTEMVRRPIKDTNYIIQRCDYNYHHMRHVKIYRMFQYALWDYVFEQANKEFKN